MARGDIISLDELKQKHSASISAMQQTQTSQVAPQQLDQNIGTGFTPTFERKQGEGFLKSALKTVGNIPRSAFELGKDVVTAVTSPVETATATRDLIGGTAAQGANKLLQNTEIGQTISRKINESRISRGLSPLEERDGVLILPDTDEMKTAAAVGNYLGDRYGSVESFKESTVEDPVGVLSDIAAVFSGVGAGLKQTGNLAKVDKLSQVGAQIGRAGDVLEPTTAAVKAGGAVGQTLSNTLPARVFSEAAPTPGRFAEGEIVKALELTQGDVRKISQNTGNDVTDFIARNDLLKETPEEISDALVSFKEKQYNLVRSEISNITNTYNRTDVPRVQDALVAVDKVVDEVPGLESTATEVKNLLSKDVYTLSEIQRVKEILDSNTNIYTRAGNVRDASTAQGLANVRAELRAFIEDEVSKSTQGSTNIQQLNNDVATARELADAIEIRETRDLTRNYSPLTSTLLGGAAFAGTGDIYTALAVAGGSKLIQTPSFRIALARALKATPAKDLAKWSKEVANNKLSPQTKQSLIQVIEEARRNAEFIEAGSQIISETEQSEQQ